MGIVKNLPVTSAAVVETEALRQRLATQFGAPYYEGSSDMDSVLTKWVADSVCASLHIAYGGKLVQLSFRTIDFDEAAARHNKRLERLTTADIRWTPGHNQHE